MALFESKVGLTLIFILVLCPWLSVAIADVSILVVRTISEYQPTKAALICSTDSAIRSTPEYYRRLESSTLDRVISVNASDPDDQLTFDLTPETEGYYSCKFSNTGRSSEVELVAYPTVDPVVNAQTVISTPTGSDVILHCPYKRGVLQDRYSVTWNRGLSLINLEAPEFSRYSILDNFSLLINNTIPGDGKAFSCNLEVNISNQVIKKYGRAVSLEVTDPIRITESISDLAILPGRDAVFTCIAVGVPQPRIKWSIGSVEVEGDKNPMVTTTINSITVRSSLRLISVTETQTGPLSCVAYHSYNEEVFLAISTANLVVLTDKFDVSLTSETNGNVRLQADLPAAIPGVFSLIVRFIFNAVIVQEKEIIHPSFKNTKVIDISLSDEQLPQFRQFRVRVTLKFDGETGGLSPESNEITLANELPSRITGGDCECPVFPEATGSPSSGDTTVYALISVFIVLVVVLLVVGTVLLVICVHYAYKKEPVRAMTASPVYYHDTGSLKRDRTFPRSVSRSSYNSESSRSSGRSRGSSRSSCSSRSSRSGISRGSSHTWSHGTLDSVRETASLNHKDLAQWGAVESEYVSSPVSPDIESPPKSPCEKVEFQPPQSHYKNQYEEVQPPQNHCKDQDKVQPPQTGYKSQDDFQPPQSKEEVFHSSLPHATNSTFIIKYGRQRLRQSDSSFEEMEIDVTPIKPPNPASRPH